MEEEEDKLRWKGRGKHAKRKATQESKESTGKERKERGRVWCAREGEAKERGKKRNICDIKEPNGKMLITDIEIDKNVCR